MVRMFERCVTAVAPDKALNVIKLGKLAFDESVVLHRGVLYPQYSACIGREGVAIQEYLAHKKTPSSRTLQ